MKLPNVSGKDTVKALIKEGFVLVSQRGSHIKVRKFLQPMGRVTIIIPNHREVKKGTLARILKQANITPNKFRRLLKR